MNRILLEACRAISVTFPRGVDGRISSAVKEGEYLDKLASAIPNQIKFEISKARHWCDFTCEGVPFNLKLSDCKTADNAFNKTAVIYSITGQVPEIKNMNFNKFWGKIKETSWADLDGREYHYLVVNKTTGEAMIKSIFAVKSYVPNPCNIMQINWGREFEEQDYTPEDLTEKKKELLRCIQKSIRTSINSQQEFAQADI